MMTPEMIDRYLTRIDLTIDKQPTRENLMKLQRAHLYHVPYENLDVMRGVPLSLETEDLFEKIVVRGRGGYCFELNGLFGELLRSLGYEVTGYFARFLRSAIGFTPMRGHMVMRVKPVDCEEAYLVDAATGAGSPDVPIAMVDGTVLPQRDGPYRILHEAEGTWFLQYWKGEEWGPLYRFSEEPQLPIDYKVTSYYCEHAPESTARMKWIVNLRTEDGRYTVDGPEFRHFHGDQVDVIVPGSDSERDALLRDWFGIVF